MLLVIVLVVIDNLSYKQTSMLPLIILSVVCIITTNLLVSIIRRILTTMNNNIIKNTIQSELQLQESQFEKLSDDVLTEILRRVSSPLDISRFAVISKGFKSVADSDAIWETFIPNETVSRSLDTNQMLATNKDRYFRLCHSPVLLDSGNLCFFLDKKTGRRCFLIGARDLVISWGDNLHYWKWLSRSDSRFAEVAHLNLVCWFDIRGKINTEMLSRNTRYAAFFVYKLENRAAGLDLLDANVRLVDHEQDCDAEKRANVVHLQRQNGGRKRRDDGWFEIEVGEFYNDKGDDGDVEARLFEIKRGNGKYKLIVEGIEFRPKDETSNNSQSSSSL